MFFKYVGRMLTCAQHKVDVREQIAPISGSFLTL